MKLRLKNTIYIGFAFLSIMVLWQAYNWLVPLYLNDFLNDLFDGNEFLIGLVMGLDNLFALFMIPIVSRASDRHKKQTGSRMKLIVLGVMLAGCAFLFLPLAKNNGFFMAMVLFAILLAMNIYRSPAVSLMPDVTPKPLHGKANAVINVMGGIGTGIGYTLLLVGGLFGVKDCFVVCGVVVVMFGCLVVLMYKVDEKKFATQMQNDVLLYKRQGIYPQQDEENTLLAQHKNKNGKTRLWFVLVSTFLFYMATNSVETFMSLYSTQVLKNANAGLLLFGCLAVGSFLCLYPSAVFAQKTGYKNAMLAGCCTMAICNLAISFFDGVSFWLVPLFFGAGCGMAFVVANVYPLVVSFCDKDHFAKYTGYYYTATMTAQTATPVVAGLLTSNWLFGSMKVLMPYSATFLSLSALVLFFMPSNGKKQP